MRFTETESPPAPALARSEAGHAPTLKAPPLAGGRGEHCAKTAIGYIF